MSGGSALPVALTEAAATLLDKLQAANLTLATAESCTGGLIGAVVTAIPGSSATLLAGYITYSNDAKMRMLGVPEGVIASVGAVSDDCARHMAAGALRASGADLAIACTGIAGPGGGSTEKPVGLVYIGLARKGAAPAAYRFVFPGNRDDIRAATVAAAFQILNETVTTR
ncbi:CinA family protein [Acetobacteraceae bacterium H6797]|nr:CinA family protein [Acetobacteraceae bacterium H6797]